MPTNDQNYNPIFFEDSPNLAKRAANRSKTVDFDKGDWPEIPNEVKEAMRHWVVHSVLQSYELVTFKHKIVILAK